jgi:hypothetical protein
LLVGMVADAVLRRISQPLRRLAPSHAVRVRETTAVSPEDTAETRR